MAVPAPALRLRPLTLMDVLDESFRLYRANFPLLAGLAVGLAIPVLAINLVSGSAGVLSSYYQVVTSPLTASPPDLTLSNPFAALLQYPVALALIPFQTGALFAAAAAIVLGTPVTIVSALRAVLRRYWAVWALSIFYGLAGFTLLCPPLGLWLLTRLSMLMPVFFTEQAPIGTTVERSWRLTDRAFWRTFSVLFLSLLLGYALQMALATVFLAAAGVFPGLPMVVRVVLIISLASLMTQLVQPLFALAVTLLYFDFRVRREAFDLEIMAYQLALARGTQS